jgi:hypothetical protein
MARDGIEVTMAMLILAVLAFLHCRAKVTITFTDHEFSSFSLHIHENTAVSAASAHLNYEQSFVYVNASLRVFIGTFLLFLHHDSLLPPLFPFHILFPNCLVSFIAFSLPYLFRDPPFCATTAYLAYPLPLATPNRFGQARPLGASAPRELSFAPSGTFTHTV